MGGSKEQRMEGKRKKEEREREREEEKRVKGREGGKKRKKDFSLLIRPHSYWINDPPLVSHITLIIS